MIWQLCEGIEKSTFASEASASFLTCVLDSYVEGCEVSHLRCLRLIPFIERHFGNGQLDNYGSNELAFVQRVLITFAMATALKVACVSLCVSCACASPDTAAMQQAFQDEDMSRDVVCLRDYSAPCPQGWADAGDGGTCYPPTAYDGTCGTVSDFKGLSAYGKSKQAAACGAVFPCMHACSADYSQTCPFGWIVDASGACLAPSTYSGPCVARKDFEQVAWTDKVTFANVCGVAWPCRAVGSLDSVVLNEDCVADYSSPCPSSWLLRGGGCVAPPSYAGRCAVVNDLGGLDGHEKETFARACRAAWPCAA